MDIFNFDDKVDGDDHESKQCLRRKTSQLTGELRLFKTPRQLTAINRHIANYEAGMLQSSIEGDP